MFDVEDVTEGNVPCAMIDTMRRSTSRDEKIGADAIIATSPDRVISRLILPSSTGSDAPHKADC